MTWRIHFSELDLRRVRLGRSPGPLVETLLAFSFLRCPNQPRGLYRAWRDSSASLRLASGGGLGPLLRPLAALVPTGSRGVDLYTLTGEVSSIEQGILALLALPSQDVLGELESFDRRHRLPEAAWAVAEPHGQARQDLASALGCAYQAFVEPYWPRIWAQLHAAQVSRRRLLADGGPERLLASLTGPDLQWRSPILELRAASDRDLYLNGSGIELVPSLFAGRITTLHLDDRDPAAPPRLLLPSVSAAAGNLLLATHPGAIGAAGAGAQAGARAVGALIGRTRAAALAATVEGCSTSELAASCGISLSAASQHATVLRKAGLITTQRQGSAVLHVITPLGLALLRGS